MNLFANLRQRLKTLWIFEGDTAAVRRLRLRYVALTMGFFLPLSWAFVRVRNLYPIASWNLMTGSGELRQSFTYFVLRGETRTGAIVDIPPINLTPMMRSRLWGMVNATASNQSLKLSSPHPRNVQLLQAAGDHLPEGALMNDLLRAWGEEYNSKLPTASPDQLRAIRIDAYQWPGGAYANYQQFKKTWREEL